MSHGAGNAAQGAPACSLGPSRHARCRHSAPAQRTRCGRVRHSQSHGPLCGLNGQISAQGSIAHCTEVRARRQTQAGPPPRLLAVCSALAGYRKACQAVILTMRMRSHPHLPMYSWRCRGSTPSSAGTAAPTRELGSSVHAPVPATRPRGVQRRQVSAVQSAARGGCRARRICAEAEAAATPSARSSPRQRRAARLCTDQGRCNR